MAPSVPTEIPSTLTAGTTWRWDRTYADYPIAEGWTVTARFAGPSAGDALTVTAATGSGVYAFTAAATATAALASGAYRVVVTASLAGAVYVVEDARCQVAPDPTTAAAASGLTHEERMLAAIEARIEGRITADAESYSIGGRSISRIPYDQLLRARNYYRTAVYRQRYGQAGPSLFVTFGGRR